MMWREYAHATAEHIKLLIERQMAMARRNDDAEAEFGIKVFEAEQRRLAARSVINEHERRMHVCEECEVKKPEGE